MTILESPKEELRLYPLKADKDSISLFLCFLVLRIFNRSISAVPICFCITFLCLFYPYNTSEGPNNVLRVLFLV